jgi:flagellar export protein FliJ
MATGLRGVIRLAKARTDDQRRTLGLLLRQVDDFARERCDIETDLAQERALAGGCNQGESLHFGPYVASVIARQRELDAQTAAAEAAVTAAREALGKAICDLRAFELAEENRQRRQAEVRVRREREELDEIGLRRHQRMNLMFLTQDKTGA